MVQGFAGPPTGTEGFSGRTSDPWTKKSSEHEPLIKQRHSSSIVSCCLLGSHSKSFTALGYIPDEKRKRPS